MKLLRQQGILCLALGQTGAISRGRGLINIGLVVIESIMAEVRTSGSVVPCIRARLMKVRVELVGTSNGASFIVGPYRKHFDTREISL